MNEATSNIYQRISSEDVESVRGALMTMPALTPDTKLLWNNLLKASLNQKNYITQSEFIELQTKSGENANPSKSWDAFRKTVEALNERLWPLLGYGYAVSVLLIREKLMCQLVISKNEVRPASEKWLNHAFTWSTGKKFHRKLDDVWVPTHANGGEIDIRFRTSHNFWSPPPGYAGYQDYKKTLWPKYEDNHKMSSYSQGWCVERFLPTPGKDGQSSIELTLAPVAFSDIVATTLHLDAELPGPGTDNGQQTIRSWLESYPMKGNAWVHAGGLTHFTPAANPLTVDVNVITKDDAFVFRWYENSGIKRWEPGIFGYVDSLEDIYRNNLHLPDPSETVFRRSCRLLGIPILPARIHWLGVGFGLKFGQVSLFGEVRVNYTYSELEKIFHDKSKFKMVKATAENVRAELDDKANNGTHRPHFEALLALSLAGNPNKKVAIETSTLPADKLNEQIQNLKMEKRAKRKKAPSQNI